MHGAELSARNLASKEETSHDTSLLKKARKSVYRPRLLGNDLFHQERNSIERERYARDIALFIIIIIITKKGNDLLLLSLLFRTILIYDALYFNV